MSLTNKDENNLKELYENRFKEHGYSPKSLYWDKSRQDIRFQILTSSFVLNNRSILDVGCGFGDLNKFLHRTIGDTYNYYGIDLYPNFIDTAKNIYNHKQANIRFTQGDFLKFDFKEKFDYVIESGIFNFKLSETNNYDFIEKTMEKSLELCNIGIAFDFLSDAAEYKYEKSFYSNPLKILDIAYKYSKNLILRNDYMPFEFSIIIFKDNSFHKSDAIFSSHKNNIK